MFRTTALLSALLLSGEATASGWTFIADKRQVAVVTGASGQRSLTVTVSGDPALGSGTQADCELRAVESGGSWHLIPFASDTMELAAQDLHDVRFKLKWIGARAFQIETDYGPKLCAAGLTFAGTYRRQ